MNKVLGCNNLMANMDVATVIFVLLIMIIFPVKTSATDYIVGDDKGWTIFYNYTNWVKDKNFYIGDAIVFKYTAGYHNVAKVNETAFRNCDNSSAGPILYTGNDRIVYGTPGNVWYICGLAKNCEGGQKLAITIQPTPPPSPPFPPPAAAPAHPAPFLPPPSRPSGGLSSKALTGIIVGITVGAIFLVIIGVGIVICYKKKRNKYQKQSLLGSQTPQTSKDDHSTALPQRRQQNGPSPTENRVAPPPKHAPRNSQVPRPDSNERNIITGSVVTPSQGCFTYEELQIAANGFSNSNYLGHGGFGYVHKGILRDGRVVAIKQLKAESRQGEAEFQAEIDIITRVHHRHLVSLVGYCISRAHRMLVYEFVPNNTLEFHLHGLGRPTLNWATRMKIAIGSAKGLAYLHEDCQPRIIHRDIKGSNILLDDNFVVKVADFGLAKYFSDFETHVSTRVMGTLGYLAPEYASSGQLTEKSDVFSFGVMLLELITGRRPVDRTQSSLLVDWARPLLRQAFEDGIYDALVDPKLQKDYDYSEMTRMIASAAACVRHSARVRPRMSQIVRALEGNVYIDDLNNGTTPGNSTLFASDGNGEYNSRQYKRDLKKFRKMVLESQEQDSNDESTSESLNSSSSEPQQATPDMEFPANVGVSSIHGPPTLEFVTAKSVYLSSA